MESRELQFFSRIHEAVCFFNHRGMEKAAAWNFLIRYGNLDFKLRSESNPRLDPTLLEWSFPQSHLRNGEGGNESR